MRDKISACIITFNEENNIRRCLESVTWCDEIVILDSFSTDRTIEICREFTDRIYQHKWMGYVGQRNLIRKKARHEWVLYLDADEAVSPALREEILAEFDRDDPNIAGYQFPRLVCFLGKWIRHGDWYPDIKLRLFKKTRGRSVGSEPHDYVVVMGALKRLKNPIHHYTYRDISDYLRTTNRYTTIAAEGKKRDGGRFSWRDWLFRPPWRFARGYLLKRGFLDGWHGLLIATVNAFGVAMKYAKIREREILDRAERGAAPPRRPGSGV
jgi:glycosyltransferase involved in cell wall biosynthesis